MENIRAQLEELCLRSDSPNLWDNKAEAEKILQEKTRLENILRKCDNMRRSIDSYGELVKMANEDEVLGREIRGDLLPLLKEVETFEIEAMFSDLDDRNDCFLEINTGVGGTDACDFSNMLLDMYLKWCRDNGFRVEVINLQEGDEAGLTNAVLRITGTNAFGWLKNESGVHRLVRISPYNANGKRQTSFSSVWVYPVLNNDIKIEIDENSLKIDTYRSSGAGGQHINKTDSAVRITHLPTKIVVQCQSQRSQHQNREEAIKLLKSRLYELERQKQQEEKDIFDSRKTTIGWGQQVRNYVMHPYQLVKDLRSGYEVSNFERMMTGEYLSDFIRSCILSGVQSVDEKSD
ncbi:MAG: peptide chain release factor 2 [Rickettsiales bacterium]|nr:peptide chain release factor 2 [Rickettsiales bacterium]